MSVLGERREGAEEGGVISPRYAKDLEGLKRSLEARIKERLGEMFDEYEVDVKVKFEPLFSELVREDPNDVNVYIDIVIGRRYYIGDLAESLAEGFDLDEYCTAHDIPEDRCEEEAEKAFYEALEEEVEEINSQYAYFIKGKIEMEDWGRKLIFETWPLTCSKRDAKYYTACYAGLGVRVILENARLDALRQEAGSLAEDVVNMITATYNLYRGLW